VVNISATTKYISGKKKAATLAGKFLDRKKAATLAGKFS